MKYRLNFQNYLISSLIFHLIILAFFVLSYERSAQNFVLENKNDPTEIVNAVIMNESKIEMLKPDLLPPPPKKVEVKKPVAEPVVKKEMKLQPVKSIEPPVVQKKVLVIPTKKTKTIPKEIIEKQLLADLEKEVKQKKKIKNKHNEIEKAFEQELAAQKAKVLEQQLLMEKNRLSSSQSKKMQGIVDKYKALILQAISQHWIVPNGANKSLFSELLIRIAPGGVVLDVQLVKSSGDVSLDRSARTAVFKASPLPVPTQSDEFEPFRQFILKVKPENIVATDSDLKKA